MSQQLMILSDHLRAPETIGKLMLALGYDNPKDPAASNDAKRYAASVLAELEKMSLDSKKKDILLCSPQSIAQVMIDAAKFRLMIDGRQLAHIVKFGDTATLQIGYRGYIAKVAEHYEDADINVFPVYEGDKVHISGSDGYDQYTHERGNTFNDGETGFQGVIAVLYYRKGEKAFQKIITMSKTEIGKVRKAAKQDFIWSSWFIEKAKAAAVKRICKLQFASISILQEMIDYDNRHNFDQNKLAAPDIQAGSIIDNLNKAIEGKVEDNPEPQAALTHDAGELIGEVIPEPEPEPVGMQTETTQEQDKPAQAAEQPETESGPPAVNYKEIGESIKNALSKAQDEGSLDAVWSVDYKSDLAMLKKERPDIHEVLSGIRAKKMNSFAGFA